MGKRKGTMLSLASLLFVFMLTTLFFYMVYNMHYDSASDDFTGFTVFDYASEPGMPSRSAIGTLPEELETWASDNHAVLFYKAFSSAGIAAVDYAGWFDETWHISFNGQEPKTAIVQKSMGSLDSYIEDDVLFPQIYNYRIVGEFDNSHSPTFQGDAFFYYPLSDITDMQGLVYTNTVDEKALLELSGIIESTGRGVEFQTYGDSGVNVFEVVIKLLFDDFVSRSMLFAFLGLIFCAVFAVYMMYRESNRYMVIHHLYGATYLSLFIKLLLNLIGIAILGTILGYVLGKTQLNLIHKAAYLDVAVFSGICNILFACIVQVLCFIGWTRKNHGKEGRY